MGSAVSGGSVHAERVRWRARAGSPLPATPLEPFQ